MERSPVATASRPRYWPLAREGASFYSISTHRCYEETAEERKLPWSSKEIPLGKPLYCGDICLMLITMTAFAVDTWDLFYAHKDLDRG